MRSTVHGVLSWKKGAASFGRAAEMANRTAERTDEARTRGGSPEDFEPKKPPIQVSIRVGLERGSAMSVFIVDS